MPLKSNSAADIAIISLARRFLGADNIDEFWQLLTDGIDAISKIRA